MDSFELREGKIWLDGALVPWGEAKVHVLTHALHFASAVFEGIRIYEGVPFRLQAHTDRLFRSAELVDIDIPFTAEEVNRACLDIVDEQALVDGYLRPIVWRGPDFMSPHAIGASIHVAVAGWPWPVYYSPEARMAGIRLTVTDWRRPPPDMAPVQSKASGLYQICTLAKHAAHRAGFDDALMVDYRDFVAETTSSNIFFVVDNVLMTPTADCFLDGITRQTVMTLATDAGLKVVEGHFDREALFQADEIFITGTAAEVTPVREIDGRIFEPGPVTKRIMALYDAEVRPSENQLAMAKRAL